MMTPLAILLLLTTGLIGSAFMAGTDDTADVVDGPNKGDDDKPDFSNGDLLSDPSNSDDGTDPDGVKSDVGSSGDEGDAASGSDTSQDGRVIRGSARGDDLGVSESQGDAGNTFHAGDGDDFIRTSAVSPEDSYTARDRFADHLGGGGNTVYGGRGDDVIEISRDDVASGDEGSDVFVVMVDPGNTANAPSVVRDLDVDDDIIIINLPTPPEGHQAASHLQDRVAQRLDGDDTVVQVDGVDAVRILGQTDLDIGVQQDPDAPFSISNLAAITDAEYLDLTGLDGQAISGALPHVIVRYYTETA